MPRFTENHDQFNGATPANRVSLVSYHTRIFERREKINSIRVAFLLF